MDGILSALIIVAIIALLWYLFTAALKWPVIPIAIVLSILLLVGVLYFFQHPFIHI